MSPSNVHDTHDAIGILDFSWSFRPRCWDLIHFIARVEVQKPSVRGWTAKLVESLIVGYGIDPQAPPASWHIARLGHALRAARKSSASLRRWGLRTLAEMEVSLR